MKANSRINVLLESSRKLQTRSLVLSTRELHCKGKGKHMHGDGSAYQLSLALLSILSSLSGPNFSKLNGAST